jgi:hypothetical protein
VCARVPQGLAERQPPGADEMVGVYNANIV